MKQYSQSWQGRTLFLLTLTTLLSFSLLSSLPLQAQTITIENFNVSISEIQKNAIRQLYGRRASRRIDQWQTLLNTPSNEIDQQSLLPTLKKVNRFFNRIPFRADQNQWRTEDYWANPLELLSINGGDCEDYAIAKYFTLRAMGVPDADLRISYVNYESRRKGNQPHMVLLYLGNSRNDPLVLDNLSSRIKTLSEREDLHAVYSFNADNLWQTTLAGRQQRVGLPSELRQWSNLLTRL